MCIRDRAYPELESHRLNRLCAALGITFSHHHANDDAFACASAVLRIAYDYSLISFEEIEECFEVQRGRIRAGAPIKKRKHRRRAAAAI